MKYFLLIIFAFTLSCQKKEIIPETKSTFDTISKIENIENWQEGFGLTHDPIKDSIWGKPVQFYIENPRCDSTAIQFYYGKYQPTDEPETARLLSLVAKENDSLRFFYRWILNKTILIQDGALGEYTGVPARQYAEKFPKEFFEYMDYDQSGEKYQDWVNSIIYSGFYDRGDYKNPEKVKKKLSANMNSNCNNCSIEMQNRIEKFSEDCFLHD